MEAEADFFGKKACIFSLIIGCVYMNLSVPVMHTEKKKTTTQKPGYSYPCLNVKCWRPGF